MNGEMILKVSLYGKYGNYSRSIPRLNLTIMRFESDDSKKENSYKNKTSQKDGVKTEFGARKKNKKMFEMLSNEIYTKMEPKKKLSFETEDEKFRGDYKMKLLQLCESSLGSKESLNKKIQLAKPTREGVKPPEVVLNVKEKFYHMAKKVAQELKIDVSETQEDLYSSYIETNDVGIYSYSTDEVFSEYSEDDDVRVDEDLSHFRGFECVGHLDIFKTLPEKEGKEEHKPTMTPEAPEGSEGEIGASAEKVEEEAKEVRLETWEALDKISLSELLYAPPKNYFDELIQWTNVGKLHRFPIDNEQDWHEEHKTDFTEHIFLEEHLEPWCPKTGALRHFMELVMAGLSKNPYLSVKKKVEHLTWYRDYFFEKSSLLKEVGINLNSEEKETGEKRSDAVSGQS